MARIKLHNPELAANSKFANLVIESLTTDPTFTGTTAVGRLWFNNTEKTFKGGFLDEAGTETEIKPIGVDNSTEVATNTAAIATNATNIASNDTDIATNATNIATEVTNRTTADTTLQGNIDTVSTDLATEVTNRTTADTTLQGNIDTLATDVSTNYLNKTSLTAQVVTAETTFSSDLIIGGNLTVSGTTTTIDTETLLISDNILTLNNGVIGIPTENAGLEVDRGDEGIDTILNWNETLDQVEVFEANELRKVATTNYVDGEITTTNALVSTNTTNITTNTTAISDETTARTDADTIIDGRIDTLEAQVGGATGDLTTLTTDVKTDLVAAINEVDAHVDTNASDIATEITNRANADTNIQAELDATQTGSGLGVDGSYTADVLTNYITTSTDLANADKLLDSQIKTNADTTSALDTRVTTIETATSGKIGDLTTLTTDTADTLVGAINEVDGNVNTEVTNRTTADTTLQTNIDTEVTNRTTADTNLGIRIDNINTAAGISGDTYTADATTTYLTTATDLMNADKVLDTTIKANLDNLAATTITNGTNLIGYEGYTEANINIVNPTIETVAGTLKETIDSISSLVNTKIHDIENRYVKGEVADADKSDTYTLAHNLDTEFVDVSVQVYDTLELVWRFDLVVIEVIDTNVVKISLASGSAEQIRYVIQGY